EHCCPIRRSAVMLVIEPGRKDDVEAGTRRDFAHQVDVPADIVWAGIDQGGEPAIAKLLDAIDAGGDHVAKVGGGRFSVAFPSRKSDHKMLVHQCTTECISLDWAVDRHDHNCKPHL